MSEYLNNRLVMSGYGPINEDKSDYDTRNVRKYLSCKIAKDMIIQAGIEDTMTLRQVEDVFFKFG